MKIGLWNAAALAGLLLLAAGGANAQDRAGNAAAGKDLAVRSCSSCHAVEAAGQTRTDAAPAFLSIARDRSPAALTAWLLEPHPPMPNLSLTVTEIRNLVAYIQGLRTP